MALLLMFFLLVIGNIHPITSYADPPAQIEGEWIQSSNGRWWYRHTDGSYTSDGWEYINGYWYHFDSDGWMQTGWLQVNSTWYYLSSSGAMVTGWQYINNYWYYFSTSGSMCTGWLKVNNVWYYLYPNGTMCTGWEYINGDWYYFNASGAMRTIPLFLSSRFYQFYPSGKLQSTRIMIDRQAQEQTKWCWAACADMVGEYAYDNPNFTITQSRIVELVKGYVVNVTASIEETVGALFRATNQTIIGSYTDIDYFSYYDVVSEIDSNQLFIIRIGWEQGGGHFVVGSGYDHVLNEIFIVNPKPESECKYYEYIELVHGTEITGVKGSWTDTIYY